MSVQIKIKNPAAVTESKGGPFAADPGVGIAAASDWLCLDSMGGARSGVANQQFGLLSCHGQRGNQLFALTAAGRVQADELCLGT